MKSVEFLDKGVEGMEGGMACVVVVEISVLIQGPVYCGFHLFFIDRGAFRVNVV
jgi:hypothetical protein